MRSPAHGSIYAVFNLFALSLVGLAYMQGWLARVMENDLIHFSKIIIVVFLIALISGTIKMGSLVRELARARKGLFDRAKSTIRLELMSEISLYRHAATTLVMLGLAGTVIGFIIAISGMNGDVMSDPAKTATMITTLFNGMHVMFYSTGAGVVLTVWLTWNYYVMSRAATSIIIEAAK